MFDSIQNILLAVWNQDLTALLSAESVILIYILSATVISLESAFLPAVPLPNDSVVILIGTLSALGGLQWEIALPLLIVAAAIGSWLAFLQGKLLTRLPKVQYWVSQVPKKKIQMVDSLLFKHSLVALFIARFVPVVRILVPMAMGGRGQKVIRFQLYSIISALMWACLLFGMGYVLPLLPENVNRTVTTGLFIVSVLTFLTVILSGVIFQMKIWFNSRS